jgi:hypothetical protein
MRKTLLGMASTLFLIAATSYQSSACVDIALVLAVDGSGSISDEEYEFQKFAIAAAFRDRDVLSALKSASEVTSRPSFGATENSRRKALIGSSLTAEKEPSPLRAKSKTIGALFSAIPTLEAGYGLRWTCFPTPDCAPPNLSSTSRATARRRWHQNGGKCLPYIKHACAQIEWGSMLMRWL